MPYTDGPARTRFAPSPTGYVHIGSMRTVLFSWLWARHTGGQFLLRIEDTDRNRYVEGAEEQFKDSLRMLGLQWDEGPDVGGPFGPYTQSERLDIYAGYASQLLEQGQLYKCWCTAERLKQVNEERQARKEPPGYDRHCRNLSAAERAEREQAGLPYVLRLAVPLEGETVINDLVRGPITFQNNLQNDMVMIKSDGFPTYHFAVVVDDHAMQISHVLRGDEWIATAPLHVLLYQFLGWQQPVWVHVPQVLGTDGKKLSKRHGATAVNEYIEQGYLPEALINFLALVGWGFDETTELMTLAELIERFDLRRISPSGGVFNPEKLNKFNGIYIRALDTPAFLARLLPFLSRAGLVANPPTEAQQALLTQLLPPLQERIALLSDAVDLLRPFFGPPADYAPTLLVPKKLDATTTGAALAAAEAALAEQQPWLAAPLEERLRALAQELALKPGDLFMMLRVAATGSTISLPLFDTLQALGRDTTLDRLAHARKVVGLEAPPEARG